jgi:hypothetical protein
MPATQVPTELIVNALQLACRAPSVRNSQPWRWVVDEDAVELFADPGRLDESTDSTGRQAVISCGAALHHFRVAAAAAGWDTTVRRFPDPSDPRHLATVSFAEAAAVTDHQRRRADAILLRRSNRLPFSEPLDWHAFLVFAAQPRSHHGVTVSILDGDSRAELAEVTDLVENLNLAASTRAHGIDSWTAQSVPETMVRPWEDHSTVLALSTDDESIESVLRCGETLSDLLLEATVAGITTCTSTHVTEIPCGSDVVASLIGGDTTPQVLVRVGRVPALIATPPPTPRRPLGEVVDIRRSTRC